MSSVRVFVTGVAGFLGSHVAEWALSQNHEVLGCDNLSLGKRENIPAGVKFYEYDILDLEKNKKYLAGVDALFHAAAWPYDNFSLYSPFQAARDTFSGTASVLSAAISNHIKRFIYCSSMSRYGKRQIPFVEEMKAQPLTPYGLAKTAGEDLLIKLSEVHHFEYVICIPHNIFGPRQVYNDPYRNAVSLIIFQMLQDRSPLIYGDGNQKRGFSPIQDLIPLFPEIFFGEKAKNQLINIGPDEETVSLNDLLRILNKIMGKKLKAFYKPFRPQEVENAVCSSKKARELLKYKKVISLEQALKELVEWIKAQSPSYFSYPQKPEIAFPTQVFERRQQNL